MTDGLRITRRAHVTDPAAALDLALRENDALAEAIAELQANALTAEERAYIRNRKEADDNAVWLLQLIRKHAPWVVVLCSMVGTGVYWLATHTIQISGPKQ